MSIIHKFRISLIASLLSITLMTLPTVSSAQCAMCTLNAENSTQEGNTQGKGLNDGILFLLAMPFMIAAGVGFLWYKKFRNTSGSNSMHMIKQIEE
ncbi:MULTISPECIES: hypothetical protein [Sphingobacterium]|uniref:Uncharacterized protein n=1 Tax=Sphingobacterium cellulitidis TaxID=1768011 RepID=A0A8H9G1X5_9SPHI|nr:MULTISPECIES: hypothetical protein [Sphingobacterium]MBA8987747.1 TctA family transporter [Sphingobacterium soli]OYD43484.1 hypothetical protein CHT99_00460 [Sphingobacterium cellulitidis]WFB64416.1 hypothetical protein PZ892_04215 [Sphingobacterium sp. WM]GGE22700.1 hypothetical protein GCM10011516_20480 [Sphingobacterium soli]